jgi:hypothetical protein
MSEFFNINDKGFDALDQIHLEVSLLSLKFITGAFSLRNKEVPVVLHGSLLVNLILVHNVGEVGIDERVHIINRFELKCNVRLLAANFFQSLHNTAK